MGQYLCQQSRSQNKMKFTTLLVLFGLLACSFGQDVGTPCAEQISAQCPDEVPGDPPVYLPDPTHCRKFCECSGGTAYSHTCAPPLMFDDEAMICNWPDSVDCGSRPIFDLTTAAPIDSP